MRGSRKGCPALASVKAPTPFGGSGQSESQLVVLIGESFMLPQRALEVSKPVQVLSIDLVLLKVVMLGLFWIE